MPKAKKTPRFILTEEGKTACIWDTDGKHVLPGCTQKQLEKLYKKGHTAQIIDTDKDAEKGNQEKSA